MMWGRVQQWLKAILLGSAAAVGGMADVTAAEGPMGLVDSALSIIDIERYNDFEDLDTVGLVNIARRTHDGWNLRGFINGGFMGNTDNPRSGFNGPYNAVDLANQAAMNQLYFIAENGLPTDGTGLGGRFDVMFGEDYELAQSRGWEREPNGADGWNTGYYGVATPQMYMNVGSQQLNLQAGHFYSVVGYEGLMAVDNFFYSKSYSYQFAGPFQHWGTQLNYLPSDAWTINAGLVNGWDAFDRIGDTVNFIGRVRYDNKPARSWTSFAIVTGNEFNNLVNLPGVVDGNTNRTRYSWLVGLPMTARVDYVFHHWLGFQEAGYLNGERADWFGIDQYLTYRINNRWRAGIRGEWFNDEEGTRVGLHRPINPNLPPFPGEIYSTAVGLNYTPNRAMTFRPEIRADWYDGSGPRLPFDDGLSDNQLMLGFDAILLF